MFALVVDRSWAGAVGEGRGRKGKRRLRLACVLVVCPHGARQLSVSVLLVHNIPAYLQVVCPRTVGGAGVTVREVKGFEAGHM